jgi:hypothetical protein
LRTLLPSLVSSCGTAGGIVFVPLFFSVQYLVCQLLSSTYPVSEIKENGYDLSISRYKEIEYEEVQYEKPEVIIKKIETLESEIQKGLNDLKSFLKAGK